MRTTNHGADDGALKHVYTVGTGSRSRPTLARIADDSGDPPRRRSSDVTVLNNTVEAAAEVQTDDLPTRKIAVHETAVRHDFGRDADQSARVGRAAARLAGEHGICMASK